jgi:hypothetical protein
VVEDHAQGAVLAVSRTSTTERKKFGSYSVGVATADVLAESLTPMMARLRLGLTQTVNVVVNSSRTARSGPNPRRRTDGTSKEAVDRRSPLHHVRTARRRPAGVRGGGRRRFWQTIDRRPELQGGRLVGTYHNAQDWDIWRCTRRRQVVCLLSSAIDVVLDEPTAAGRRVEAGRTCIVPRRVAPGDVREPGDTLHIRGARAHSTAR